MLDFDFRNMVTTETVNTVKIDYFSYLQNTSAYFPTLPNGSKKIIIVQSRLWEKKKNIFLLLNDCEKISFVRIFHLSKQTDSPSIKVM